MSGAGYGPTTSPYDTYGTSPRRALDVATYAPEFHSIGDSSPVVIETETYILEGPMYSMTQEDRESLSIRIGVLTSKAVLGMLTKNPSIGATGISLNHKMSPQMVSPEGMTLQTGILITVTATVAAKTKMEREKEEATRTLKAQREMVRRERKGETGWRG